MDLQLLSSELLWVVLALVVIVRQFLPRPIRPAVMVGLPLVAGYLGVQAPGRQTSAQQRRGGGHHSARLRAGR